jgi:hypothetical protein
VRVGTGIATAEVAGKGEPCGRAGGRCCLKPNRKHGHRLRYETRSNGIGSPRVRVIVNTKCSGRFPKNGDFCRVAAKGNDVESDPFECKALIQEAEIVSAYWAPREAEST